MSRASARFAAVGRPEPVAQATKTLAENAAHLVRLFKADPYC